jgi:hypothetical protein
VKLVDMANADMNGKQAVATKMVGNEVLVTLKDSEEQIMVRPENVEHTHRERKRQQAKWEMEMTTLINHEFHVRGWRTVGERFEYTGPSRDTQISDNFRDDPIGAATFYGMFVYASVAFLPITSAVVGAGLAIKATATVASKVCQSLELQSKFKPLLVGDQVMVAGYSAKIIETYVDGTFDVVYDDGSSEQRIDSTFSMNVYRDESTVSLQARRVVHKQYTVVRVAKDDFFFDTGQAIWIDKSQIHEVAKREAEWIDYKGSMQRDPERQLVFLTPGCRTGIPLYKKTNYIRG